MSVDSYEKLFGLMQSVAEVVPDYADSPTGFAWKNAQSLHRLAPREIGYYLLSFTRYGADRLIGHTPNIDDCTFGMIPRPSVIKSAAFKSGMTGLEPRHIVGYGFKPTKREIGSLVIDDDGQLNILTNHTHGKRALRKRLGEKSLEIQDVIDKKLLDEPTRVRDTLLDFVADIECLGLYLDADNLTIRSPKTSNPLQLQING